MKLAVVSIQRNRAKWLKEWVLFHHLVGVSSFYIYLHKCTDNSKEILATLSKDMDIKIHIVNDDLHQPQLASFNHAYQTYGNTADWLAFIDGDEFLYPTNTQSLLDVLAQYQYADMSALGVYWQCFGSNGHVQDPNGLIISDYTRRAPLSFESNSHVKSIVRGFQGKHCQAGPNSHMFNTILGTFDELRRPIQFGLTSYQPTYQHLCINHYACQSYDFYKTFKMNSGAADAGANLIRPESWWITFNRNEEEDKNILRFEKQVLNLIEVGIET
jgi:hypothetical protein